MHMHEFSWVKQSKTKDATCRRRIFAGCDLARQRQPQLTSRAALLLTLVWLHSLAGMSHPISQKVNLSDMHLEQLPSFDCTTSYYMN